MLKKIDDVELGFLNVSTISKDNIGTGICYVYGGVLKNTQAGAPFVTLFLRDINGVSIPGYIFNLESPLVAGKELNNVIGKVVKIDWRENFITGRGLTLIIEKVGVCNEVSPDMFAKFVGAIHNLNEKKSVLLSFLKDNLGRNVTFVSTIYSHASPMYCQGRVGGLLEHYYSMIPMLSSYKHTMKKQEFYHLIATFAVYIFVHSRYVISCGRPEGFDALEFSSNSTNDIVNFEKMLGLGQSVLEVVNMFFGYKPRDIYLRIITRVSELVRINDEEYAVYKSLPLTREGGAGFGTIKRYVIEEEK